MDFQAFVKSLDRSEPPDMSPVLRALWYDKRGDWERAHQIVQDLTDTEASWIHAYLHRKEGDLGNAGYWYRRAGKTNPQTDLDSEWEQLVKELI